MELRDQLTTTSLEHLPVELRMAIFSYVLDHDGVLQRQTYRTAGRPLSSQPEAADETDEASQDGKRLRPIQTSLLGLNRLLHEEALDVLYALNKFRVSFNHLCTCQAKFPYAAFDERRIRHVEIYDFYPREDGPRTCRMCLSSGVGLIRYVNQLPKLRTARVIFEDFISLVNFIKATEHEQHICLTATEVGRLTATYGKLNIEMELPMLYCAWQLLHQARQKRIKYKVGDDSIADMLLYFQFEADTACSTPKDLASFFVKMECDDRSSYRLQLRSHRESACRMVEFAVALAEAIGEIFLDEEGGHASISWVRLEGATKTCWAMSKWDFSEGVAEVP